MPRIRVSTTLPAPPGAVWAAVSDLASHVDWMADAEAIRFTTRRRSSRFQSIHMVRVTALRLLCRRTFRS